MSETFGPHNPYPGDVDDHKGGGKHDVPTKGISAFYHRHRGKAIIDNAEVVTGLQEEQQLAATLVTAAAPAVTPQNVILPRLLWRASPNCSHRVEVISGIVVHETEGGYAGSVSWLCRRSGNSSAHVILREDGMEATQIVTIHDKAWHAVNANSHTIGLEMAGFTARGNNPQQLLVAARICAFWMVKHGIPRKQADNHGYAGICRHRDLGSYGGNHGDPGGFDWDHFRQMVFDQVARGGFRDTWTR